jgi:hypothetical protein
LEDAQKALALPQGKMMGIPNPSKEEKQNIGHSGVHKSYGLFRGLGRKERR